MKRRRLLGKQSVVRVWAEGRDEFHFAKPHSVNSDTTPDIAQQKLPGLSLPDALSCLDIRGCCQLEGASRFWRGCIRGLAPVRFENMWLRCHVSSARAFLDVEDWCQLEAASCFWRQHAVGEATWHALSVDRFGICAGHHFDTVLNMASSRALQKFTYFAYLSWRIVPGLRAAGIRIGQEKRELRTKRCDEIEPHYTVPEYLFPGQGYFLLDFKLVGGPVKRFEVFETLGLRRACPSADLPVVFEEESTGNVHAYCPNTDFTGQSLTIWTDGSNVNAVGVHSPLGVLQIPGRPDLKGISVGIACQQLLRKLGTGIDDVMLCDSNPGGPKFWFEQLPRVCFEVDAANGGLAEVDDVAWDIEWLRLRLHHPISAIFAW